MKTYSKITVDSINPKGLKGMPEAQIRQTVTTSLPSKRTSNNLSGSLYSDAELGITANNFDEVRVAWIPVKADSTIASVQADLDKSPIKQLVRYLASSIILSDDQMNVYKNGLRNTATSNALDSFNEKYGIAAGTPWGEEHVKFFLNAVANRQVVRKGGEGADKDEVVLFNGKQQFRRIEFPPVPTDDIDTRITQEVVDIENVELAPVTKKVEVTAKAA